MDARFWVTSVRQRDLLSKTREHLANARQALTQSFSNEFAASDLRLATQALGEITGETASEEVLDRIFTQFCIGK